MNRNALPWLGLIAGISLGVIDFAGLTVVGIEMEIDNWNVTLPVMVAYGFTFGALGYVIGRLALARDKLRLQNAALRETQEQLIQYEKLASLGRMAAGVAHEVRNPLGVMRASAALIEEGLRPDQSNLLRACVFIREEVDQLNGFVTNILDFARPLSPDVAMVTTDEVVERALRLAEEHLSGLEVVRPAAQKEAITVDPDMLVRALLGLLVNAAQALEGSGRVCVDVSRGPAEVTFDVADDGPGVEPTDADKLFEPFFSSKAQGTGLGLPMALRIAQAHQGQLAWVAGAGLGPDGAGARFRLSLPVPPC